MNAPMVNVLAKARRFADFLQGQLGPTIPTSSREAIIVILQERLAPKPVFDPLEGLPR